MEQQLFVIEFGTSSAELLVDAGTSRAHHWSVKRRRYLFHADHFGFLRLERWRLFLNREVCPYRYGEVENYGIREMGRSRSPDWI